MEFLTTKFPFLSSSSSKINQSGLVKPEMRTPLSFNTLDASFHQDVRLLQKDWKRDEQSYQTIHF